LQRTGGLFSVFGRAGLHRPPAAELYVSRPDVRLCLLKAYFRSLRGGTFAGPAGVPKRSMS
jgi:hypothetical protein